MLFLLLVKSSFGANKNRAQCCLFPLLHSLRTSFSNPLQVGSMFWCFNLLHKLHKPSKCQNPIEIKFSLCVPSSNNKLHIAKKKGGVAHKISVTKLCKPQFQTHVLSMSCHTFGLMRLWKKPIFCYLKKNSQCRILHNCL